MSLSREDRQLLMLIGAFVLVFGTLFGLIIEGMRVRRRLEEPRQAPGAAAGPLESMRLEMRDLPGSGARISAGPVTNAQFGWFVDAAGGPRPASFARAEASGGQQPALVGSPAEAEAFAAWLAEKTGRPFRLATAEDLRSAGAGDEIERSWVAGERAPAGGTGAFRLVEAGPAVASAGETGLE